MTDEELARKWVLENRSRRIAVSKMGHPEITLMDQAKHLAALISRVRAEGEGKGRAEERERCAGVCDERLRTEKSRLLVERMETRACAAAIREGG